MSERVAAALGRKVISRSSAEELGPLTHLVIDVGRRRVSSLVVGKGRKAQVAAWEGLTGFGPDAVILTADDALHPPGDDHERAAAHGDLELLGRRALSESGNELGEIDDVIFDPTTGDVLAVVIGRREHPVVELVGAGSYAAILSAASEDPPAADPPAADPPSHA